MPLSLPDYVEILPLDGGVCSRCRGAGWLMTERKLTNFDSAYAFGYSTPCPDCTLENLKTRKYGELLELSNLKEFDRFRFDNFEPVAGTEKALETARKYSQTFTGWLVLYGKWGVGKTHLAAAIAHEAVASGKSLYFTVVEDLLNYLQAGYANDSYLEKLELLKSVDVLILDDFGTENATGWAYSKIFQIINHRYNLALPLVVTANDVDSIDGRLFSRLFDQKLGQQIEVKAEDYRLKRKGR